MADSTSADVNGLAASAAKARRASLEGKGRAAATVSTQRWTSTQGLRVSAARAGSAVLNSASFMLAASSVTNAGIHGDGYAEAGLPAPDRGRTSRVWPAKASASWN